MPDVIVVWQGDPISNHWYKYEKIEPPTYLGFCHVFSYLYMMFCPKKTIQTNLEIVKFDPVTKHNWHGILVRPRQQSNKNDRGPTTFMAHMLTVQEMKQSACSHWCTCKSCRFSGFNNTLLSKMNQSEC